MCGHIQISLILHNIKTVSGVSRLDSTEVVQREVMEIITSQSYNAFFTQVFERAIVDDLITENIYWGIGYRI